MLLAGRRFLSYSIVTPNKPVAKQQYPQQRDIFTQAMEILSLIWVDIQDQLVLADLARIHELEGYGEGQFTWIYIKEQKTSSTYFLDVGLQKPVRESFHIIFRVEEWW